MFGLDPLVLAVVLLTGCSAGAVAYAFLFNRMADEKNIDKRKQLAMRSDNDRAQAKANRDRVSEVAKRRKTVQDTLKELDQKQKARDRNIKKPPLRMQIRQAGMTTSVERFYVYSVICGIVVTLFALFMGAPLIVLPGALVAGIFGLPRWYIGFKRSRRVKQFLAELPNALDVIVRAVKSGLPLNDGIRLIAAELLEPVRGEFRRIVESQQVGMSIPEAALRMSETMPCPEASFFGIVIQIQQQAGGNLSEALGNLSRVLRDRKKMKARVSALSMEAKASAAIIGALPFIVATMVYIMSPGYILPLFTTSTGNIILGCSAIWMAIGIFVMRKMITFDV